MGGDQVGVKCEQRADEIYSVKKKKKGYTIGQELEEELWDGLLVEEDLEQILMPREKKIENVKEMKEMERSET